MGLEVKTLFQLMMEAIDEADEANRPEDEKEETKNHIVDLVLNYEPLERGGVAPDLRIEDIETAKQIIDILIETGLPIFVAADILDFCKHALRFSGIAKPGKI